MTSRPLVGRERERAILAGALGRAPREGTALIVRGAAGIGKSALLRAVVAEARPTFTVLGAQGVQAESGMPFAGLHQLLRPVLDGVAALPAPQRTALLAAFGMADPGDAGAAPPDLFLTALATLGLLTDAGAVRPVLLVVEDAQWLDRPSVDVLSFVARRIGADPVVLLVAARSPDEPAGAFAGVAALELGPLSPGDAAALLDARSPGLPEDVRERVLVAAGGNPLALIELPAVPVLSPRGLPVADLLEQTFATRYDHMPAPTRALLLVAAAESGGDLPELLQAASDVAGGLLTVEDLAPATAAGLVEVTGTRLRFRHPLMRSAVYAAADPDDRHAAHAALARALGRLEDRRAWHRAAAEPGPDDGVADDLAAMAERSVRRGALPPAIDTLQRAALASEDPSRRADRFLRAAELACETGQPATAAGCLRDAGRDLDRTGRCRAAVVAELVDPGVLHDRARVDRLVDLAAEAGAAGEPGRALDVLWHAAFRCFWATLGTEPDRRIAEVTDRLTVVADDPRRLAILALAAPTGHRCDVARRLGAFPPAADAATGWLLGIAAAALGRYDVADRYLAAAAADLRAQGRLGVLSKVLSIRAYVALKTGDLDVVRAAAEESAQLADGAAPRLWAPEVPLAVIAGLRGDLAAASGLCAEAERYALAVGSSGALAMVQAARGRTALGAGEHAEAFAQLRRLYEPSDPAFHRFHRLWYVGDLVEAAVHSGRAAEARTIVEDLELPAELATSRWFPVGLCYAEVLLTDDVAVDAVVAEALAGELGRHPFMRARVQLEYGWRLRRLRRIAESRVPLLAACDLFDALGAHAWGERARRELRASGERSAARRPRPREQLTAQELQIARLAADGLSNREIGDRLFLSPRTIGSHLYRLFPKLGIVSRTQLRDALGER